MTGIRNLARVRVRRTSSDRRPISNIPPSLKDFNLTLKDDGQTLTYIYDARGERTGITGFLKTLSEENIKFRDLNTKQSSLEEIFVELVKQQS